MGTTSGSTASDIGGQALKEGKAEVRSKAAKKEGGAFDENYEDEDEKFPSEDRAEAGGGVGSGPPPGLMFISGGATASGEKVTHQ